MWNSVVVADEFKSRAFSCGKSKVPGAAERGKQNASHGAHETQRGDANRNSIEHARDV